LQCMKGGDDRTPRKDECLVPMDCLSEEQERERLDEIGAEFFFFKRQEEIAGEHAKRKEAPPR
jgi:hypothetical protein